MLRDKLLSSQNIFLITEAQNCKTDLDLIYMYDRYMRALQSEILYSTNTSLKEKLRTEFNRLTALCELDALILRNELQQQ